MHGHACTGLLYLYVLTLCVFEGCSLGVLGQGTVQCDFTETNLISSLVTAMLRIDRGA